MSERKAGTALLLFRADDPAEYVARVVRIEAELGRLSVAQAVEVVERFAGIGVECDELRQRADDLKAGNDEYAAALALANWQLKVALAALGKIREDVSTAVKTLGSALDALTSSLRPPTPQVAAGYGETGGKTLECLSRAVEETYLRPGQDDDFREVAKRHNLEDDEER